MALTYNIEKDIRYNQGLEKGRISQQKAIARNLLLYTSLTIDEIAKVIISSPEFVTEIKNSVA